MKLAAEAKTRMEQFNLMRLSQKHLDENYKTKYFQLKCPFKLIYRASK